MDSGKIPFGELRSEGRRQIVLHHTHLVGDVMKLLEDGDILFLDDALHCQYVWLMENCGMLEKRDIPVILGISPGLLRGEGDHPVDGVISSRLHELFHKGEEYLGRLGFMSWSEVQMSIALPNVYPANHGYNHLEFYGWREDVPGHANEFRKDVLMARRALEERGISTDIFVYPYDLEMPTTRRWLGREGFRYVFGGEGTRRMEIETLKEQR